MYTLCSYYSDSASNTVVMVELWISCGKNKTCVANNCICSLHLCAMWLHILLCIYMTIFHDTLRGLHNVLVFRNFLEIWFLDIWQVYENYSRKTTKDTDVTFLPVVRTCISYQLRLFVILWLYIEPLQPISSNKDELVRRKRSSWHIISQYWYTSDILALNYLIW